MHGDGLRIPTPTQILRMQLVATTGTNPYGPSTSFDPAKLLRGKEGTIASTTTMGDTVPTVASTSIGAYLNS